MVTTPKGPKGTPIPRVAPLLQREPRWAGAALRLAQESARSASSQEGSVDHDSPFVMPPEPFGSVEGTPKSTLDGNITEILVGDQCEVRKSDQQARPRSRFVFMIATRANAFE